MQKTREGLLQTLLFQLLRQSPELMPAVSPERWQTSVTDQRYRTGWEQKELEEAIIKVIAASDDARCFCFFVDGLDECCGDLEELPDEAQSAAAVADQFDLVKLLRAFGRSEAVKLCVSSRPWNVFRDTFGSEPDCMFVLQELTRADMDKYISGVLLNDQRFIELQRREKEADELATELRVKAEGVFLWVRLAVKSLLRGLSDGNNLKMLRKRLRDLPTDLFKFLKRILDSIEETYQGTTCRLLVLANYAAPLPLITFYCIQFEIDDPDCALATPIEPIEDPSFLETP
jgi:hypothetical protein